MFLNHACWDRIIPNGWGPGVLFLFHTTMWGASAVDLFFVLSGFLITSLLIEARPQPSYYHDFYWKRALRILPLYVVCLVAVAIFVPGSHPYVFLSALFLSNFTWIFHVINTGPFWTLAIEEQFYLLWPTVVRPRSVSQIRRAALAVGVGAVLLRIIGAAFGHYNYYFTFLRCDGLAFGAYLACRFRRTEPYLPIPRQERGIILLGIALGLALAAVIVVPAVTTRALAFRAATIQTGVTLLYGSFIALVVRCSGTRALAPFRSRLLTFFGLISYAMYMFNLYVIHAYDHLRGMLPAGDVHAYAVRFVSCFAITVALSVLSRYLIELPAISLRKHVLARPAPPDPAAPPIPLRNM